MKPEELESLRQRNAERARRAIEDLRQRGLYVLDGQRNYKPVLPPPGAALAPLLREGKRQ
jgi:hypothetical protein